MAKPSIDICSTITRSIFPHVDKFENVTSIISEIPLIRYSGEHSNVININIISLDCLRGILFDRLVEIANPRQFMQTYVILEAEYIICREFPITALLVAQNLGLKVIFTSGHAAAIKYAVGLLEKAAKQGILDLRPTSI